MTTKRKPKAHYDRRRHAQNGVMNPLEARDCPQAKIAYKTERIAKAQAAKAAKFGKTLWAYKCPFCHLHHLTSQEPR